MHKNIIFIVSLYLLFYNNILNAKTFELDCSEKKDVTKELQTALKTHDKILLSSGICTISDTIIVTSKNTIFGTGKGLTTVKLKNNINKDMFVTKDFSALTGTKNIIKAPMDFIIKDLTLDGNYLEKKWQAKNNRINNFEGSCLKIYGSRFIIDIEAKNCAEHGLYVEGNGKRKGLQVASTISIFGTTYGKEALIFRGPGDINIKHAVLGAAGILPKPLQHTKLQTSDLYPKYKHIDSVVIDRTDPYQGTVEIDFMHTYAAFNGVGFRTRGNPRVQVQHLISESNLGGIVISPKTWGGISLLDIHSNGKTVPGFKRKKPKSLEGVLLRSKGPFSIGSASIFRTHGSGEDWTAIQIDGSHTIVNASIRGTKNPKTNQLYYGDAIRINGNANIVNITANKVHGHSLRINGNSNIIHTIFSKAKDNHVNNGKNNLLSIVYE